MWKKIRNVVLSLLIVGMLALGLVSPVSAAPITPPTAVKAGDTLVLAGGYVAVCIGFNPEGVPIYQADMSTPIYEDNLTTKIDTTWHLNPDGSYTNGADNFKVTASSETISLQDTSTHASIAWTPNVSVAAQVTIGFGMARHTITQNNILVASDDGAPTLLSVDPINSKYQNNTLQWDLGNGVYRNLRLIAGEEQEYYTITEPLNGDLTIQTNEVGTGIMENTVVAYDSESPSVNIPVTTDDSGDITLAQSDLDNVDNLTYPITIDPSTSFTATASDSCGENTYGGTSNGFATMIAATSASFSVTAPAGTAVGVGNWDQSGTWGGQVYRDYLYYNTTGLTGYTITSAYLNLYGYGLSSISGTWHVQVQNGQPTYPTDPYVASNFNQALYSGNGGQIASTAMTIGQYDVLNLNGTGLSWINTTGETKFCLRELEHDINATDPNSSVFSQENYWSYYDYSQGIGYQPQLVVTFLANAPSISSVTASNVAQNTAQLNASITSTGGDTPASVGVRFGYGTTTETAPNFSSYTHLSAWVYGWSQGQAPTLPITGLSGTTTYYYRVQITNSNSTVTSVSEQTFTTSSSVSNVTSFYSYPSATSLTLNWVDPSGASDILIMYRPDTYPVSTTDGTQVYPTTGTTAGQTTYTWAGLTSGTTYYFSVWGVSGAIYSATPFNYVITTGGAGASGLSNTPVPPAISSNWLVATNTNVLQNMQPLYGIITNTIIDWGMPVNVGWTGLWMLMAVVIGMFIYMKGHAPMLAFIVLGLIMGAGVTIGILPKVFIVFIIVSALGAWGTRPTYNV